MILGSEEALLWTLLRKFETDTLDRYRQYVPVLAIPEKAEMVEELQRYSPTDDPLHGTALGAAIEKVQARTQSTDAEGTLFVQGLILESLGRNIYALAEESKALDAKSYALAEAGRQACQRVAELARGCVEERFGTGPTVFEAFAAASHPVLTTIDSIAEPVNDVFAERFDIHFVDLMGEFTADLLTACQALGMERRKVVGHLASASMGF